MTYLFGATRMAVEATYGTIRRLIDVAFSLRAIPIKESTHWLQNQISTACAPRRLTKDVGGNDTYGITRNPFCYGWRARGCEKSGIERSTQGDYPGSVHK